MKMKRHCLTLLTILILMAAAGCGYDPQEPPYDTAANPENFPELAISLLDRIQDGRLRGFEPITNAFGDLYSSHGILLSFSSYGTR